jgi:hypothetical protein
VSQKNGDKARFGKERKKNILRRKRTRELKKALLAESKKTPADSAKPSK